MRTMPEAVMRTMPGALADTAPESDISRLLPVPTTTRQKYCSGLETLLLGDLRGLLEEPDSPLTNRWLLATLDMLLAAQPREADLPADLVVAQFQQWQPGQDLQPGNRAALFPKLQRLRDRIAHGTPALMLANDIRCDLRAWFEG